ncbi:dihydrolipoamide dehydrogenase [Aerococcus sanguinicola]|uniref:Dihydrolipoamide dehydrogenase n=1 Tax=Aerococcus sanguinicola TaxID=119206 RepID=A0A109RD07_9LACT|nr:MULTISPECIES: hypothetical protein [Aerococcus]AMB93338.1 hypothetical protein AWM72_00420 [Aerococcus sanguinicola]MDK7049715.1 dihydrolipoamide dehydrogenase [Aerococcus sanguinicola]OFT92109.1 hypothetical protein HMPREF3090_09420 [Aerococcus sp. HMSC23C02]PKZ23055.1 dihydrolipoamide dehydrogenase [Aerococcus sanguinicola]
MVEQWQGLPADRFAKYRSWINREEPGICGSYVTAALVHDRVLADTGRALDPGRLLGASQELVDDKHLHKGTFIWNIYSGLDSLLGPQGYRVKVGLFSEVKVPDLMAAGYGPFIVGTAGLLGSPYGNHWLLAYAYRYNDQGDLEFRCYDNHGQSQAVLPAKYCFSYAYLERLPETADKQPAKEEERTHEDQTIHFHSNGYRQEALQQAEAEEGKTIFGKSLADILDLFI